MAPRPEEPRRISMLHFYLSTCVTIKDLWPKTRAGFVAAEAQGLSGLEHPQLRRCSHSWLLSAFSSGPDRRQAFEKTKCRGRGGGRSGTDGETEAQPGQVPQHLWVLPPVPRRWPEAPQSPSRLGSWLRGATGVELASVPSALSPLLASPPFSFLEPHIPWVCFHLFRARARLPAPRKCLLTALPSQARSAASLWQRHPHWLWGPHQDTPSALTRQPPAHSGPPDPPLGRMAWGPISEHPPPPAPSRQTPAQGPSLTGLLWGPRG